MCKIRINETLKDVAEMYLNDQLEIIRDFLQKSDQVSPELTAKQMLAAVNLELAQSSVARITYFVCHPYYAVGFPDKLDAYHFMADVPAPFGFYKLFHMVNGEMIYLGKYGEETVA